MPTPSVPSQLGHVGTCVGDLLENGETCSIMCRPEGRLIGSNDYRCELGVLTGTQTCIPRVCDNYVSPLHTESSRSNCTIGSTQPYGSYCVSSCSNGYGILPSDSNNLISNPDFSYPIQPSSPGFFHYRNSASVPGWFIPDGIIVRAGSVWGFTQPFPVSQSGTTNNQCLSVQGAARVEQEMLLSTGTYQLRFFASARPGYTPNTIRIAIISNDTNNTIFTYQFAPTSNNWLPILPPFILITESKYYKMTISGLGGSDPSVDYNGGLTSFSMIPIASSICDINGWRQAGVCMESSCRFRLSPPQFGTLGTCEGRNMLQHGSTCSIACQSGYQLVGSGTYSCRMGTLESSDYLCIGQSIPIITEIMHVKHTVCNRIS